MAFEVSRRLVRRGHEVGLLSGQRGRLTSSETVDGVEVTRSQGWLGPHVDEPGYLSAHSDADVIIDDLGHAIPWATPLISDRPMSPLFYHLHRRTLRGQTNPGMALILASFEPGYRAIYHGRKFVTISPSSARDLASLGIHPGDITVIPPGVDLELFRPGRLAEQPELVYFGGLRPYK
jgi:glycosyltransferase involved in cell wall biosynthesis